MKSKKGGLKPQNFAQSSLARGYNCCNRTLRYSQFFSDFTRRQGSQVMHHQNNSFFIWERSQNICQSFRLAHISKFTVLSANLCPHQGCYLCEFIVRVILEFERIYAEKSILQRREQVLVSKKLHVVPK